jgi:hypothetical protein
MFRHQHDRALVWNACARMMGITGRRQLLDRLVAEFAAQFHRRGVQYHVSTALVNSCGLWVVRHLLRMHERAVDDEARFHLELCPSRLHERDSGPIWAGPPKPIVEDEAPPPFTSQWIELDRTGYVALVKPRIDAIRQLPGVAEGVPIAEGAVFALEPLAKTLLRRVGDGDRTDRMEWERMLFEATTGVPCGAFFNAKWQLQSLAAAAVMEDFLASGDAARYEPGVRYFFGRRVPV